MGQSHGEAHREEIRAYAAERIDLVCSGTWSKRPLERATVLELAERCLPAHRSYSPDLTEEMAGIGDATDLSLAELLIVGGFTDFVDTVYGEFSSNGEHSEPGFTEDDCTSVIVPDHRAGGSGFVAQTWDMHDSATQHVIMLDVRPDNGPRAMVFTTNGCLGQIGMNDAGIAIGINNLPGADGRIGVTWPMVVRKALMQTDIEAALACITDTQLAGAHNYLLLDANGKGYNVEAFSTATAVTALGDDVLAHTNHCLLPETQAVSQDKATELQESSDARLATARTFVDGAATIEFDDLVALTQHPTVCYRGKDPYHVETCGAAIMRPGTQEFWACWGLPSENPYQRFSLAAEPAA